MKPEVILLLQCQSFQIQQSNAKCLSVIGNMLLVLHAIQLLCPSQESVGNGLEALLLCLCSGIFLSIHFSQLLISLFTYLLGLIAHAVTPLFIFIGLTLAPR